MHLSKLVGFAAVSLTLSACCNTRPDPSAMGEQPVSSAHSTTTRSPITLSECKASTEGNVGIFVPTVAQVIAAAEALPKTCLPTPRIADALSACAAKVGARCIASVEAPDFTACQHTVKTLQTAGRNFVLIEAFMGEGATFYGEVFVVEMTGDVATLYYTGFTGDQHCEQGKGASARMKADWPTLDAGARQFICPG